MSVWGRRKVKQPELEPMEVITHKDPNAYYDYNDMDIVPTKNRLVPDKPESKPTKVITPETKPLSDSEVIETFNLKPKPLPTINRNLDVDMGETDDPHPVEAMGGKTVGNKPNPTKPLDDLAPGERKIYGYRVEKPLTTKDPE